MKIPTTDGVSITPETKISVLLESRPALEAALIELAPAFSKLRNPILRKTVARITTVMQAAKIGGVPLSVMINTLRQAAGQAPLSDLVDTDTHADIPQPSWMDRARVVRTLDTRPMLERGEHPVGLVLKEVGALQAGQIFELITPFEPIPLIDKAKALGYNVWSRAENSSVVKTYFAKTQ